MNSLVSVLSRCFGLPQHARGRPARSPSGRRRRASRPALCVEPLEDRSLLSAAISISDAFAMEGAAALKFLDRFISDGSTSVDRPRSSIFGPDGNLYVPWGGTNGVLRYD